MKFEIQREPYEEGDIIFKKKTLEIEPNTITCFVGCNGSGKTTLIREIKEQLHSKAKEIVMDYYHNTMKDIFKDKNTTKYDTYYLDFNSNTDTTFSANDYFFNSFSISFKSTGEGIIDKFGRHTQVIGTVLRSLKDKRVFIFLDDCDAGTSIDMIRDIKEVFNYIVYDCIKNNLEYYIILTANSYELCKDCDCISVHDFKHKTFKTYESYKKFVLKSREEKNKRFPKEEGNE